jgi:hypothetical protein
VVKPKQKRIALIGLPVFQSVNNLSSAAGARHAEETGCWRFVFSAEASVAAFKFLRTLDCDGAILRVTSDAMRREAEKKVSHRQHLLVDSQSRRALGAA